MDMNRLNYRAPNQLRPVKITPHFAPNALGSVLFEAGNTRVICSAMVQDDVPHWKKQQKISGGWLTVEYSMLPYSTHDRKPREISKGRADGRSVEIQRLIGRALRAVVDLELFGARTLWVDCDVLQADGGTRTASISGACVAVALAIDKLLIDKKLSRSPLKQLIAAVSVGVVDGKVLLDLDYSEDNAAEVDANIVMTECGQFVEIQASGEEATFDDASFQGMLTLARGGIGEIISCQRQALSKVK